MDQNTRIIDLTVAQLAEVIDKAVEESLNLGRRWDDLRTEEALQSFEGLLLQADLYVYIDFDWFHKNEY